MSSNFGMRRRSWFAATTMYATAPWIVAWALVYVNTSAAQPASELFDRVGLVPQVGAQVPLELEFVDADGRQIRLAELLSDRPVILHLVYYECPMLCKLSSDGLLRSLKSLSLKLGEDFSIITVSFDPREGPELSAKARELAIERCGRESVVAGWRFLTGNEREIEELCSAVGFRYFWDEQTKQFAHASGAFVLTADGKLSRYLSGVEFAPRDLRLALVEASAGKVGTAADQVLLLCYMYDPITGRYGLAIIAAVRIAGIATVCGLGLAIFIMLRRERSGRGSYPNVGGFDETGAPTGVLSDAGYAPNPWSLSASEAPPQQSGLHPDGHQI